MNIGLRASQVVLVPKNLTVTVGDTRDTGSILGSGRCPGVGIGNPLQYSCLENSMDRGAWWTHKEVDTTEQLSMHDQIKACIKFYPRN